MKDLLVCQIEGSLLSDGGLFLYAASSPSIAHKWQLKRDLFAWDETTLYGTTVETTIVDGREGITLDPVQAMSLFTAPASSSLIQWKWLPPLHRYTEMFQFVRKALLDGQYVPDFERWRQGDDRWKFRHTFPIDSELEPVAEEWLNRIISHYLLQDHVLQKQLTEVAEQQPVYSLPQKLRTEWVDEEEWRSAIGLKQDGIPFRVGIRLSEPSGRTGDWELELALQSRQSQQLQTKLFGTVEQLETLLPAEWSAYYSVIERTVSGWLIDEPWLLDPRHNSLKTRLDAEEAYRLLSETIVSFANKGIPVYLPSTWKSLRQRRPKLRAVVATTAVPGAGSFFNQDQLFSFDWKLAIGSMELDEKELVKLAEGEARMENISGEWVMLSAEMLREIRKTLQAHQSKQLSVLDVMKLQLTMGNRDEDEQADQLLTVDETTPFTLVTDQDLVEEKSVTSSADEFDIALTGPLFELIEQLRRQEPPEQIEVPGQFCGELRPYQQTGVSWLVHLRRLGIGCCLADDMGLGKTIQFIVYLQYLKSVQSQSAPSLLICPTSVLGNWLKEFEKFAPNLRVMMHYGTHRYKEEEFLKAIEDVDVVISTYTLGLLDQKQMQKVQWDALCLDEAQHIKNAYTKQAVAVRKFEANHRIAMTGTPLENRLSELWSIFQFLNPGYLGSLRQFQERYARPIEIDNDQNKKDELRQRIHPFLLRRDKNDPKIGLELPGKSEVNTYVSLTVEQAELYQDAVSDMLEQVDHLTAFERKGWIVSKLTRLKQICDHPALVLDEVNSERVFEPNRSLKLERLVEMVTDLRALEEQCLIFTQYVGMGQIIKRVLERELNEETLFMYGGVPQNKREEMIEQFQAGKSGVFVLSLRAGGSGLNLTAASHVFHYDRWWNPAVEDQATDRVYRIGQKKQVYVYKMVALGTLEERIDEMLTKKRGLTTEMLDTSGKWISELSVDELKQLLTFNDSLT